MLYRTKMNFSLIYSLISFLIISHLSSASWEPDWENSANFMGGFLNLRFHPYSININTNTIQEVFSPTPLHLTAIVAEQMILVNTGQSIQTINRVYNGSTATGGPLQGKFESLGFIHYWNRNCGKGITGTTINGKGFCYEARVLWKNSKYNTIAEAVHHSDGLFELVFLFEICSATNQQFNKLSDKIQKLQRAGSFIKTPSDIQITAANFMSPNVPYYSYFGSFLDTLTGLKHKCSTVLVIKPTLQYCITEQQFEKTFSNIQNFCGDPINNTLPHDFSYVQVFQGSGITQDLTS